MEVRRRRVAKNKRKLVLRLLLLAFLVLVIAAGIIGGLLLVQQETSPQAQLSTLPFSTADQNLFTGSGFLYIQNKKLYYHDLYNEKNDYSADITSDAVTLAGSPSIHALYNSAALILINAGGYPIEFSGNLLLAKCGASYFAALKSDVNGKESIQVYDQAGAQQVHLPFDGQFIVDYGFYTSTNEYLYVISMSVESSLPLSTITIYNLTNLSQSGVMQLQNQLIEDMYFTSSGIYAVGTNQIIRYSLANNRECYRETVYGWRLMDFEATTSPSFLLCPRNTEALGTVKVLTLNDGDVANTTQRLFQLPANTMQAFLMDDKLVAFTSDGYTVFSMSGKELSKRVFAATADRITKLDHTTVLIEAGSSCYTLKIA